MVWPYIKPSSLFFIPFRHIFFYSVSWMLDQTVHTNGVAKMESYRQKISKQLQSHLDHPVLSRSRLTSPPRAASGKKVIAVMRPKPKPWPKCGSWNPQILTAPAPLDPCYQHLPSAYLLTCIN